MILRGLDFGHVFCASGARGFYGEGYGFHKFWRSLGLDYEGSTLVTKTTTLQARAGNLPLGGDNRPIEWIPKCIVVKLIAGVVLNSVGLSGPGIEKLLHVWDFEIKGSGAWVASVTSVAGTQEEREEEYKEVFASLSWLRRRGHRFGVELNFSCPNAGHDGGKTDTVQVLRVLDFLRGDECPVFVKVNALVLPQVMVEVSKHPACNAVVCSNTIPWRQKSSDIPWDRYFGSSRSPLEERGFTPGGLSGKPLLPIVAEWVRSYRVLGGQKPVVGCGGVLSAHDAGVLLDAGASAIALGTVSILRPWRVRGIIRYVNDRIGGSSG